MKTHIIVIAILITNLFALDFSKDISPIIYTNCTTCHRPGEIGEFLSLTSYENIFENRDWIAYAVSGDGNERHGNPIMPPWPADREYSSLVGEMFLTENQIHTILEWINEGAPQGDPALEYPMPDWPIGSAIGDPNIIFEMEESYFVEGNYEDDYRCFVIETGFDEDKDVSAIEFRPGNSVAVHHALIVAVPDGAADAIDEQDPGYGYECFGGFGVNNISDILGGYAPGLVVSEWPAGLAQKIPANSDLILQIHYAPLNTDEIDQSSMNIFFKDDPVERYIQEAIMIDFTFALPPEEITEVENVWMIPQDISLVQFLPHCHFLGKSWEIYAISPSNDTIPIISIPEWNFDWQFFYSPEYMLHIPAQSALHAKCVFDNTSENPDNPNDPPEWMFWGEGSYDEMFFVPFRYVSYQEGDESVYLGSEEDDLLTMDILSGWNLVGLPLQVDDSSYDSLFPDAITGTLYSYDGAYYSESTLEEGNGYWLRFQSGGTNSVIGTAFHELTLTLSEGWNLISGTSLMSEITDPGNIIIPGTLYGWDYSYVGADYLDPGKGYWVRANGNGDITLTSYWLPRIDVTFNSDLLKGANLLKFSNSSGSVSNLYFLPGFFEDTPISEDKMLSYSLPPVPPAGGFDVRFAGDMKFVENGGEILLQNEIWPLNISLEKGAGNKKLVAGDWYLVDEVRGKEYRFSEKGTIEITEPTSRLTLYRNTLTPEHFSLHQNYPNPFNPVTNIRYDLPKDSDVFLAVYDLLGREVAVLVSGKLVSGTYEVVWNGTDKFGSLVSAGVYYYQIKTTKYTETKKLVLLK